MGMSRRRLLFLIAATGVAVAIFAVVLPRIASYHAVWQAVRHLRAPWAAGLAAATVANLVTFAYPWMVVLPGLGFLDAMKMTQASTAFTFAVPGGATIGMGASFAMLRTWGFAAPDVGRAVALTGIWNQMSTFLFPVAAAVALAVEGAGGRTLDLVALLAALVFVLGSMVVAAALLSERNTERLSRLGHAARSAFARLRRRETRPWSGERARRFRTDTVSTLRREWLRLTVATFANQLAGFVMLDLTLRSVGIGLDQVGVAESFAAWSIARLITSLPLTPGGLGIVELGLVGMLAGFGGPTPKVVAAVLVFRVLSMAPTALLGLLAFGLWNHAAPNQLPEEG